jgi:plastocyanin
MRMLGCLLVLIGSLSASDVGAAQLTVKITDADGHPAADSIVTVVPQPSNPVPLPAKAAPQTRVIDQKEETFIPYVQIVRPGDPVVFRNSDDTRHHVYSFSKIKAFEFVLSPGESSAPFSIEQTGIAVVGCNIHDNMINYLFVSDAPWIGQSGTDGTVRFADLPAGAYTVHIWHPQSRPGNPETAMPVAFDGPDATRALSVSMPLLPDPRRIMDHERMRY